MWYRRLGHASYRSPILRKFPAPYLQRFSRRRQEKTNGRKKKAKTQQSIFARKVSAKYKRAVQTWLSHEVATKWLALGLKLRLETESLGDRITWYHHIRKSLAKDIKLTSTTNRPIRTNRKKSTKQQSNHQKSRRLITIPSRSHTPHKA